jgi:hypothetical protein
MSAGEQVADIKLPWWQQPSEFTAEKEIPLQMPGWENNSAWN